MNYTVYHCHTDCSNLSGAGLDSITTYKQYIKRAKECEMKSLAFSEHGNLFLWLFKKEAIEAAGMKYIHAAEVYLTEELFWNPEEGDLSQSAKKIRDNYHAVLIAKNFDGFKELNALVSKGFTESHRYYAPRITFSELFNTSNNIIICTACVASPLCKGTESARDKYLEFLIGNKDRVFLEVQHHNTEKQKRYNKYLLELSEKYGFNLIAGTDTHALNDEHAEARKIMQRSKKIEFNDDEAEWDLTWKTYDELVDAYKKQGILSEKEYLTAIENTNKMADMVEPFELDKSFKFPKIFDNPDDSLYSLLMSDECINYAVEDGFDREIVINRLKLEYETFKQLDSCSYILLQKYIQDWCHRNNIWTGPARGSAAASLSLYVLRVTEVNPLKHDFAFWRFMDKSKYSLPDVDLDWGSLDRDRLKAWLLESKMDIPDKIHTTEIITFNTLKLKSAINDVARGLDIPLSEAQEISKAVVEQLDENEQKIETIDEIWRLKYPELFKYVDLVQGISTSIGVHPSGVVVSDLDLESEIGTCYVSGDDFPVSTLSMKQLDALNYVKEDVLSLDNVYCINETCKEAGIPKLSAKTVDLEDKAVWKSITEDTSLIFEMNSNYGQRTMKLLFSDSSTNKIKTKINGITDFDLLAYANALIRPCGKGVYDKATMGEIYVSGVPDIDDCLKKELGYPIMQESQMRFVQEFCGYSFLQADKLRKTIGKKLGTKDQLPIIRKAFEENAKVKYNLSDEKSNEIIGLFLRCVLDATNYSFSSIHSYSYSYISYECAWLRYYYPLEYITSCLNAWSDKEDKTIEALTYAEKVKIPILPPRFRHSKAEYFFDKETKSIYKGTGSVKYLNDAVSDELYALRDNTYNSFTDLLKDVLHNTTINSRQLDILVRLGYFSEFGTQRTLLTIVKMFYELKLDKDGCESIKKDKYETNDVMNGIIQRHAIGTTKSGNPSKSWTITDIYGIMYETEEYIRAMSLPDLPIKTQIADQKEYYGRVEIKTGKSEDRPKIVVLSVKALKMAGAASPWGVSVEGQSIGSGKKTSYTIKYSTYKNNKINTDDIILIRDWFRNQKGYFYITKYDVIPEI